MTTLEPAPESTTGAVLFDSTLCDHLDTLRAHHAELPPGPVRDAVAAGLAALESEIAARRARIVRRPADMRAIGETALARYRAAPPPPLVAADTTEAAAPADTTDAMATELAARAELLDRAHAAGVDIDGTGLSLRQLRVAIVVRAHVFWRIGGDASLVAGLPDARLAEYCDEALAERLALRG